MKTKRIASLLALTAALLLTAPARAGGVEVWIGLPGGWAPPRFCAPSVIGGFRPFAPRARFGCYPLYSPWGYFPGFRGVTYSPGFRVSPAFSVPSAPAVIRVPAPILTAPTVPVEPTTPFRWRR